MGNKIQTKKGDIGKYSSLEDIPESAVSKALSRTLLVKQLNTSRCTTSQELADRFDKLFQLATLHGFIPTVEMLGLCSGWDRRTIWDIENRCKP